MSASEIADLVLKGAAPEADQRLAEELEAAEAADASQPAHRRFRGVTRKWYGDAARYNAAFSLLGDRFSLGGYDSSVQAARAWDRSPGAPGRRRPQCGQVPRAPPQRRVSSGCWLNDCAIMFV